MKPDPDSDSTREPEPDERPMFPHPQWMVGVVLIFAVVAIVAGLRNPVWWLIGSPCILVLVIWIYVRIKVS